MDLDPLQGTPGNPRRSLPTPATLLRFSAPTAAPARRSTIPGFHTRFVPPPGFLTLLTVSSLRHLPIIRPEPLMGFTLQSFSPSRSRTPFGAVALMPFLTSRSSALRTRGSRCPATSGLYSSRGSVSRPEPEGSRGPMLSWVFRLSRAFPAHRGTGFPAPSFLRFDRSISGRSNGRRSKALSNVRVGTTFAGQPDSLEVLHQDLPSGSPDDSGVLSNGSERIWSTPCGADRVRRPDPPSEEGTRVRSEDNSR